MLKHIGIDGKHCLGQGGGLCQIKTCWNGQGVARIDGAILGIAAAAKQGGNRVTQFPAKDAVAKTDNLACRFEA